MGKVKIAFFDNEDGFSEQLNQPNIIFQPNLIHVFAQNFVDYNNFFFESDGNFVLDN